MKVVWKTVSFHKERTEKDLGNCLIQSFSSFGITDALDQVSSCHAGRGMVSYVLRHIWQYPWHLSLDVSSILSYKTCLHIVKWGVGGKKITPRTDLIQPSSLKISCVNPQPQHIQRERQNSSYGSLSFLKTTEKHHIPIKIFQDDLHK